MSGDVRLFEANDVAGRLKTDKIWLEAVCMKFQTAPEALHAAIDEFVVHCITIGVERKSLQEFKRHFVNWVYARKRHEYAKPSNNNRAASRQERDAEFAAYVGSALAQSRGAGKIW